MMAMLITKRLINEDVGETDKSKSTTPPARQKSLVSISDIGDIAGIEPKSSPHPVCELNMLVLQNLALAAGTNSKAWCLSLTFKKKNCFDILKVYVKGIVDCGELLFLLFYYFLGLGPRTIYIHSKSIPRLGLIRPKSSQRLTIFWDFAKQGLDILFLV